MCRKIGMNCADIIYELNKLLRCCVPTENYKLVKNLIGNERYHYVEPQHKTPFVSKLWEIGQTVESQLVNIVNMT